MLTCGQHASSVYATIILGSRLDCLWTAIITEVEKDASEQVIIGSHRHRRYSVWTLDPTALAYRGTVRQKGASDATIDTLWLSTYLFAPPFRSLDSALQGT